MAQRQGWSRRRKWAVGLGVPLALLLLLALLFRWDWLIPIAEAQASAALGRPVTIQHLHVSLGRTTTVTLEGLEIGNPPGFDADRPLAAVPKLRVALDAMAFLRDRSLVIPSVALEQPQVALRAQEDGRNNYSFPASEAGSGGPPPLIGALILRDARVHALLAGLKADFTVALATEEPEGEPPRLLARAEGTYAAQPITAELRGGAILNLRDPNQPWPVELRLANGPTRVNLQGTLQDPLAFGGANLRLDLAGPDMARLTPLVGVPIPPTPPFRVTGKLDYAHEEGAFRFTEVAGKLGNSDLNGAFAITPGGERPVLAADLASRSVDLADLGGFIGTTPVQADTPGATREQRRQAAREEASPRLLPDTPVSVPRLRFADIHLRYRAAQIKGRGMPFDSMEMRLDIDDGVIRLRPLRFGIGQGGIGTTATLTPQENGALRAQAEIELRRVDISRLMQAAGAGGAGTLGGVGRIDSTGRSLAELLGRGDGALTVVTVGGNLSALLVDLSGLQFGNALLSALGIPARTEIECLIGDFGLRRGQLSVQTLLLDTDSYLVSGGGEASLARETLDLWMKTESKRFTIGSLPTPIGITGRFKEPSIRPAVGELAARAGAAAGLGVLFPPLALLPTIQLGVGENNRCEALSEAGRRRGR
ncbi:AsmA family protein [Siccirubricoccus sp. KC 17139]|uniref:AsmA family protein n=1 Tax=Siccirubricoccus soli TaxID=2899147 RepID=A0ABT1D4E9_9PROT|nr:AsmA family protein [Siccirubricoccus soli]MCO6416802.1 AsmA family protein [Siccirubricoccus soli]MCP2682937.1 AsmA family protein [Siccirubricoccus soli]